MTSGVPALVIANVIMPEKDGIETVKEILAIDSAALITASEVRMLGATAFPRTSHASGDRISPSGGVAVSDALPWR